MQAAGGLTAARADEGRGEPRPCHLDEHRSFGTRRPGRRERAGRHALPTELFRKLWIPSVLLFIAFATFVVSWSWVPYFGGYMVAALYSMVIVVESMRAGSPLARFFSSTVMRAIGRVSFTAFIWHLWVFIRVNQFLKGEIWAPLRILIAYSALAVVTFVAWYIAERPFMRLPPVRHPAPVPT